MLTARFDRLRLAPGERVLDLGCGEGRHCHGLHMLGGVEVVGVDLDEPSLEKARAGLETLPPRRPDDPTKTSFSVADATALPFPDDSFDALICSEVLEHLPDYPAAIKEMRRVLKPGGRLCVTVPRAWPEKICWRFAPPPKGYPFDPGGHLRIFHRIELRCAVEEHGFKHAGHHHAHALHAPYWWLKTWYWRRKKDPAVVRAYHRFLVWDLMKRPWLTRLLEWALTPVMGKSLALYFEAKPK